MPDGGNEVKARDTTMTLDEFRRYYDSHRGVISSVRAYDAACRRWAGADELFERPGAYTLIVVRFKNNTFLRVDVKPSLEVRLSPKKYSSPATWSSMGINLTYDEKEFLGSMADKDMTLEELIRSLEASSFEGKDALLVKIRSAMKKMKR
jgi:hypothetical protein